MRLKRFLRRRPAPTGSPRGMTLVEVMVTGAVFTLTAGGILALALRSTRDISGSLADNVAFDAAGSLMDQLKAQKFGVLLRACEANEGTVNRRLLFQVHDYAHQEVATIALSANALPYPSLGADSTGFMIFRDRTGAYDQVRTTEPLGDQRIPFNHSSRTGAIAYLKDFAARVELTPIRDSATGVANAIRVRVRYRYGDPGAASAPVNRELSYIHANL